MKRIKQAVILILTLSTLPFLLIGATIGMVGFVIAYIPLMPVLALDDYWREELPKFDLFDIAIKK